MFCAINQILFAPLLEDGRVCRKVRHTLFSAGGKVRNRVFEAKGFSDETLFCIKAGEKIVLQLL